MRILEVPKIFQPNYVSTYPSYSNGKNMEEIFYLLLKKKEITSDYIYVPIFWTSFYITRKYGTQINDLLDYLETLDKTKKYFTIVQYATGIFVKNEITKHKLNMIVFSAGGGGINIKKDTEKNVIMNNQKRVIFIGDKGHYDIPLLCNPLLTYNNNTSKTIKCSFMGRFDTHPCRFIMQKELQNKHDFKIMNPDNYNKYKELLEKSEFALCPRGYGYTSFRLFEAMALNCIPIYIWEDKKVLPYEDQINWEDFCIIVHTKDLKKIPEIINNLSQNDKQDMINKIKQYNKEYFNFDSIVKYIKSKIC